MKRILALSFISILLACGQNSKKEKISLAEPLSPYDTVAFQQKAKKIESFFETLATKQNFHGTVLISYNEHVLFKGAFGYQDPGKKKHALKLNSVYQLASVSKQFTAAAILKLAEQGKLNLEDSIQKFYPNFPYKNISIKLLLQHRGGLSNYTYFSEKYSDRKTPLTNQGVVEMMIKHQPPVYFFPDRRMDYSNTGYVLLAAIVEKVSGKTFKKYMEEDIFKPLGMKHTHVLDVNNLGDFNYVDAHDKWGAKVRHDYLDGTTGDKGIYSTVDDMHTWDRVLYSGKFLSDSTLDSMYMPGSKKLEGPFNYAFGWRTYTLESGEVIVYHGGWWNGFKTFFMRDLENRHSIIILCNNERSNFRNLDPLVDIIYDRKPNANRKFSAYLHHSPGRK
jgi:CubicO group peptidase (beta-lactamase class C family)